MNDDRLKRSRDIIGEVDREMARLFVQRMDAVRDIAEYKRERGLPILDADREREVIERNLAHIESEDLRDYYVRFIQSVMDISKQYQRRLTEDAR